MNSDLYLDGDDGKRYYYLLIQFDGDAKGVVLKITKKHIHVLRGKQIVVYSRAEGWAQGSLPVSEHRREREMKIELCCDAALENVVRKKWSLIHNPASDKWEIFDYQKMHTVKVCECGALIEISVKDEAKKRREVTGSFTVQMGESEIVVSEAVIEYDSQGNYWITGKGEGE